MMVAEMQFKEDEVKEALRKAKRRIRSRREVEIPDLLDEIENKRDDEQKNRIH